MRNSASLGNNSKVRQWSSVCNATEKYLTSILPMRNGSKEEEIVERQRGQYI